MKRNNILGAVALIIIGITFGAILVSGFGWVHPSYAEKSVGSNNPPITALSPDAVAFNEAFVQVADKVTPSIVQIRVVTKIKGHLNVPESFKFFFPFRDDIPKERQGGGSGIIIRPDGYILTNNHVVEDATNIRVGLLDKREFDAEIIGRDPLTDLAVIKIDADDLKAVYLGNSDNIKVGQWVMAIGNPLSLTSTVTAGIVSATGRSLDLIKDNYGVENYIQTDAAINPGNSGGALVDLNGSVIGINSAIATNGMTGSYIGYGFAIPVNLAKTVAEDLISNGKVTRGYIGVSIEEVNSSTAKAVGLDRPTGVIIQKVVEGGAASKVDLKAGDIILKINEKEINQPNELQSFVASQRAGSEVKLLIFRGGKKLERYIKLKARDDESSIEPVKSKSDKSMDEDLDTKELTYDSIGLTVKNINKSDLKSYGVENGILITNVKNFSRAFNQRLFSGLVITDADGDKIESIKDFEDTINNKKGKAVLLTVVDTNGNSRFVGLEIPE